MQLEKTIKFSEKKPNIPHTIFGTIITGYLLLLFLLYRVNTPIIISVITFDFLFVSLLFPLKGALFNKTILLLAGNFTGLMWNLLHFQLTTETAYLLGDTCAIILSLISPILNFLWIVAFWSLGLSLLTRENLKNREPNKK